MKNVSPRRQQAPDLSGAHVPGGRRERLSSRCSWGWVDPAPIRSFPMAGRGDVRVTEGGGRGGGGGVRFCLRIALKFTCQTGCVPGRGDQVGQEKADVEMYHVTLRWRRLSPFWPFLSRLFQGVLPRLGSPVKWLHLVRHPKARVPVLGGLHRGCQALPRGVLPQWKSLPLCLPCSLPRERQVWNP